MYSFRLFIYTGIFMCVYIYIILMYMRTYIHICSESNSRKAKLYFRHGAMGSAKTLNLLAIAHSYEMRLVC